ncbi:glycosyltransferase family 50 protein [Polychaeton citri CBS 116435]|uniref:GPI mannosyltransferase 1 n=1 Tax=Polychaeton citri CBS 116435 TaxID=1314669 RepID=A0A9P4Q768_9PEZI|nr:glycosyltransferase family 50 protein [Polychaeton citri CBS 116435]
MAFPTTFFSRPWVVFTASILLRLALLFYGKWQDANSPVKYTDIDYLVFTDAARFVARHRSPYDRATYRYTPLLAWLLLPTSWGGWWFESGKAVFAVGDVVAGWLVYAVLRRDGSMGRERALRLASIWLLNPMVANISTRGSSEGLLAMIVLGILWAVVEGRLWLAGVLLGFAVHFKIYPFIYGASIFLWLHEGKDGRIWKGEVWVLFNESRIKLLLASLSVFIGLNVLMYKLYGMPFIEHTFLYHLIRIDHRHNFSVYNTLLHLNAATNANGFKIESFAFIPQIMLAVVAIPFALAKLDLPSTMLAQTFVFVTFNKVCTSQYFLWYMVFLPFYLPKSTLLARPGLGVTALLLWVLGQAAWLQQGYELEFLGHSTFVPGLWLAGLAFFGINCWILGIVVSDVSRSGRNTQAPDLREQPAEPKKSR